MNEEFMINIDAAIVAIENQLNFLQDIKLGNRKIAHVKCYNEIIVDDCKMTNEYSITIQIEEVIYCIYFTHEEFKENTAMVM